MIGGFVRHDGQIVVECFLPTDAEIPRRLPVRPVAPAMDELASEGLAFVRRSLTEERL